MPNPKERKPYQIANIKFERFDDMWTASLGAMPTKDGQTVPPMLLGTLSTRLVEECPLALDMWTVAMRDIGHKTLEHLLSPDQYTTIFSKRTEEG